MGIYYYFINPKNKEIVEQGKFADMPFMWNTFNVKDYDGNIKHICIEQSDEDKYRKYFDPKEYHLTLYDDYYNGVFKQCCCSY